MTDSLPASFEDALADSDEDALAALATDLADAPTETQKACATAFRDAVDESTDRGEAALPAVEPLLDSGDRAVRLTAVKGCATLAAARPSAVDPLVSTLTDLLDDDFYYVRGRAAETLGYVALADPDAIDRATVVARLLNALSLDRPEIRQHVAAAVARIALGDPGALRSVVGEFDAHLDDGDELVRYHLTTAVVAVATEYPTYCRSLAGPLRDRLDDDQSYVRGRAAEALGLVAPVDSEVVAAAADRLRELTDGSEFVADRARFALADGTSPPDGVADRTAIAEGTPAIVDDITGPPEDAGCPHCGETLGGVEPPFCPACGAPIPR